MLVHHKGRRFRRSAAGASSVVKDGKRLILLLCFLSFCDIPYIIGPTTAPHTTLPPPTPPSGKNRDSIHMRSSKKSFPHKVGDEEHRFISSNVVLVCHDCLMHTAFQATAINWSNSSDATWQ